MKSRLVLEPLDTDECWRRLSSARLGRISVSMSALPVILPVFFAVHEDCVVFATTPDSALARATVDIVVAFEADGYLPDTDEGWSVVLQGVAHEVTDPVQLAALEVHDLRFVAERGDKPQVVAIPATTLSGRTFRASSV